MKKALVKANDKLLSFCKCTEGAFATTGQVDCPWCGCGWMFSCTKCRKAFIFAKVVETQLSCEEIAQIDQSSYADRPAGIDDEGVVEEAAWLRAELEGLEVGTECVILDGKVIPTSARDIAFDGWFAHHDLEMPPQIQAGDSREEVLKLLGDTDYWLSRELPESGSP